MDLAANESHIPQSSAADIGEDLCSHAARPIPILLRGFFMDAVTLLKQDHKQVAALLREFENASEEGKSTLAGQICQLLTLHAQIEEELLYPAARGVLDSDDDALVDEATVEHASLKDLIGQIETAGSEDDLFVAKVMVLGEYVTHHVKEEEGELFPKLQKKTELDLDELGEALELRKGELMTALGISADAAVEPAESANTEELAEPAAGEAPPAAKPKTLKKRPGARVGAR
jgi:hemerythrin superfamily protein